MACMASRIAGTGLSGITSDPTTAALFEGSDVCWICLEDSTPEQPLRTVCACRQRPVHPKCLARWQLQQAGKQEERCCRFCYNQLPDWRASLTPPSIKPVTPVMAIKFEGKTYKLRVQPGPEGLKQFKEQVRTLLGFDITEEFDVSFECQVPTTGEKLKLTGLASYGAATHCAAITAAEREVSHPSSTSSSHHRSANRNASSHHSHHHQPSSNSSSRHRSNASNQRSSIEVSAGRESRDGASGDASPSQRYRSLRSAPARMSSNNLLANPGATTTATAPVTRSPDQQLRAFPAIHGLSDPGISAGMGAITSRSASPVLTSPVISPVGRSGTRSGAHSPSPAASSTLRLPALVKAGQAAKKAVSRLFAL